MNRKEPYDDAVHKAVDLFLALAAQDNAQPLSQIAKERGIPTSSAYRLIQPFLASGLLAKPKRQRYRLGLTFCDLAENADRHSLLRETARPHLETLAKQLSCSVHLGVWDEDMVRYLVKADGGKEAIFTREGMQLEAYCSAVGKVLLAHMSEAEQTAYLANGPFVALTAQTMTDPDTMLLEWQRVRDVGYAFENGEVSEALRCIAVPLRGPRQSTLAAISVATTDKNRGPREILKQLEETGRIISARLF